MKAVVCIRYGSPEVLKIREIPKPVPKSNQILVKIMATAVNSGDARVRGLAVKGFTKIAMRLVLGIKRPRKQVLGTVFSGIVESVGNKVSKFEIGDAVFGMTGLRFGTYAEYIAVNQNSNVIGIPVNASYEEAAAIIFGGQAALHFLEKARIAEWVNPKVLIIGATGSVGSSAVQIAKYHNANITAVCSSCGLNLVKDLGVTDAILYDRQDFTRRTDTFDIILDAVGKTAKNECRHLLSRRGVYLNVNKSGYASEKIQQLQLLKELFEQGTYKAVIDKIYPIEQVVDAHRYVDTGRKKGNVILKIGE